jgi:hypothetical protein
MNIRKRMRNKAQELKFYSVWNPLLPLEEQLKRNESIFFPNGLPDFLKSSPTNF